MCARAVSNVAVRSIKANPYGRNEIRIFLFCCPSQRTYLELLQGEPSNYVDSVGRDACTAHI